MKTKSIFLHTFFFLLFSAVLIPPFVVSAQQSTPSDDEVNAIARQIYCPVCENTPLDVCPTTACHQWHELIRQMLAEGKSEAEIKQYFVDHYGARVLSEPLGTGINWLMYIVPSFAFLAGVTLLFRAFRIWKRQAKEPEMRLDQSTSPGSNPESSEGSGIIEDDKDVPSLEEELK